VLLQTLEPTGRKNIKNRKAAVAVVCMGGDGVERPEGGKRLTTEAAMASQHQRVCVDYYDDDDASCQ
jgi:hypothetical protein